MDAKPLGVARCTTKVSYKNDGHYVLQFKVGKHTQIGSIVLEMDGEMAEEYQSGGEWVVYFEKVVKSESGR